MQTVVTQSPARLGSAIFSSLGPEWRALAALVGFLFITVDGVFAQDTSPAFAVRELFRIGGLDAQPEAQFVNETLSLALGPNEQLFVLDFFGRTLQVFSAEDGRHIRTVSRSGDGPGELTEVTALGFDQGGNLWISEPFAGHFEQFDSTGTYIRTVQRRSRGTARCSGRLDFDEGGRLVEMGAMSGPALLYFDTESGAVVKSLKPIPTLEQPPELQPYPFARLRGSARETLSAFRLAYEFEWSTEGHTWFARRDQYRVLEIGPNGDTLRTFAGPRERDLAPTERAALDELRRALRAPSLVLGAPQLQSIVRLPEGHLLVQLAEEMNAPGRSFDVFRPDGAYAGRLTMPMPISGLASPAVTSDRIFLVGVDEFDVPVILALDISPSG